jgi:hypothetical protein
MTCPRCHAENRDGARFCRECGATFAVVCSGCGGMVGAGSKFCDRCGAPLAATPAQPTAPPRFASPESYAPKHHTRRIGARASEAHALCLAADVASTGGSEDAEGYYREALALASELGMRPLVAHCHLGLGKLYRRTGNRQQAEEHLATSTTMYREMGMTFWLEKAEAALECPLDTHPEGARLNAQPGGRRIWVRSQAAPWASPRRFPRLRLADAPLEWRAVPGFRGPARLWVRVD